MNASNPAQPGADGTRGWSRFLHGVCRKHPLLTAGVALVAVAAGISVGWVLSFLPPHPLKVKCDQIQKGMTRAEVEAILGPPSRGPFEDRVRKFNSDVEEVQQILYWDEILADVSVSFTPDDWRVVSSGFTENSHAAATRRFARSVLDWFRW